MRSLNFSDLYSKFVVTTFQAFAFHVNRELWNCIFSQTELRSLRIGKEKRNAHLLRMAKDGGKSFNSLLLCVHWRRIEIP